MNLLADFYKRCPTCKKQFLPNTPKDKYCGDCKGKPDRRKLKELEHKNGWF